MSPDASASLPARSNLPLQKAKALRAGSRLAVFAPASPASDQRTTAGFAELRRLGFSLDIAKGGTADGYFAASTVDRRAELLNRLADRAVDGLVALRGGYGSTYLLEADLSDQLGEPKNIIGFSDLTSLQIYLWQRRGWVTFYGPMVAAGVAGGARETGGDDEGAVGWAASRAQEGWE